jgi:hypothetical protein
VLDYAPTVPNEGTVKPFSYLVSVPKEGIHIDCTMRDKEPLRAVQLKVLYRLQLWLSHCASICLFGVRQFCRTFAT